MKSSCNSTDAYNSKMSIDGAAKQKFSFLK